MHHSNYPNQTVPSLNVLLAASTHNRVPAVTDVDIVIRLLAIVTAVFAVLVVSEVRRELVVVARTIDEVDAVGVLADEGSGMGWAVGPGQGQRQLTRPNLTVLVDLSMYMPHAQSVWKFDVDYLTPGCGADEQEVQDVALPSPSFCITPAR